MAEGSGHSPFAADLSFCAVSEGSETISLAWFVIACPPLRCVRGQMATQVEGRSSPACINQSFTHNNGFLLLLFWGWQRGEVRSHRPPSDGWMDGWLSGRWQINPRAVPSQSPVPSPHPSIPVTTNLACPHCLPTQGGAIGRGGSGWLSMGHPWL